MNNFHQGKLFFQILGSQIFSHNNDYVFSVEKDSYWNITQYFCTHRFFLTVSPSTELFTGMILQGGSALTPGTVTQGHRAAAVKLANSFNCSISNTSPSSSNDVLACLRRQDAASVARGARKLAVSFPGFVLDVRRNKLLFWNFDHIDYGHKDTIFSSYFFWEVGTSLSRSWIPLVRDY